MAGYHSRYNSNDTEYLTSPHKQQAILVPFSPPFPAVWCTRENPPPLRHSHLFAKHETHAMIGKEGQN